MSSVVIQFKAIRNNLFTLLESYSEKELSIIPKGFKNNLYWNIAHCITTQQLLVYYLSGNEMIINNYWIDNFKKGTFASHKISENNKENLFDIFQLTTEQFEKDYNINKFIRYKSYSTSFGLILQSCDEAISFNNMHESLHYGYCLALQKLI